MSGRWSICFWTGLATLVSSCPGVQAAGLDSPCPIEWQGVPFENALRDLAGRLELPYVVDASVSLEATQRRVRLVAFHVDGRQALRWLARSAGLEAVVVDNTVLVAQTDRLPEAWKRASWVSAKGGGERDTRWEAMKQRVAAVEWVDAPLSVVVRDLPKHFSVDLVVHPEILAKEVLVHFQRPAVTLEAVCDELGRSLDAEVGLCDGVIWARPHQVARTSAASAPAVFPALIHARTDRPLRRVMAIDRPLTDWQAFKRAVARATGLDCRIEVPVDSPLAGLEASGPAGDILDGARLLGLMGYQLQPGSGNGPPTLLIQVQGTNR